MKTEKVAASASLLCLVHCMLMPVMFTVLPTTAAFYYGSWAEKVLLGVASVSSLFSLCWGYRRHNQVWPALFFSMGFTLMAYHGNIVLSIAGCMSFLFSMLLNRHLCRVCQRCNHHATN